jgi:hypothetical protein
MGKNKIIQYIAVVYLGICTILSSMTSCGQQTPTTPKKFKNNFVVDSNEYTRDSTYLYYTLETMAIKNIKPFTPSTYYTKSTKIYVDSILFSPNNQRMIVFVISRVEIKKSSNGGHEFEYNANFLFCKRDTLQEKIRVFEYSPYNLGNFETYKDVQTALYELCFVRRSSDPWNEKEPRYNMDDIRFWNSQEFNDIISKSKFVELE